MSLKLTGPAGKMTRSLHRGSLNNQLSAARIARIRLVNEGKSTSWHDREIERLLAEIAALPPKGAR